MISDVSTALAILVFLYGLYAAWKIKVSIKDNKPNSDLKYANPLADGRFRNQPCPCLSGRKMKSCHGKETFVTKTQREEYVGLVVIAMNKTAEYINDKITEPKC